MEQSEYIQLAALGRWRY